MQDNPADLQDPQPRLSAETEAVIRALRLYSQPYADLFESIGRTLEEPLLPAWRRIVAHFGRELTTGLPTVLLGSSVVTRPIDRRPAAGASTLTLAARSDSDENEEQHQPARIAQMVSELTGVPLDGLHRSRYVVAFMDVHDWFQERTHQRRYSGEESDDHAGYRPHLRGATTARGRLPVPRSAAPRRNRLPLLGRRPRNIRRPAMVRGPIRHR
jgi:hypothetical protein